MNLDDDLNTLLTSADQPYDGPMIDPDPVSRYMPRTGQLNPVDEYRLKRQEGTYLSGVDNMRDGRDIVERAEHQEVYDAEEQDDVLGSGIFDPERRPGTANTNMGVLQSRYSLPGYVAREIPFTTSQDVTDLTANASVVSVPGGGMAYVEAYGRLVGPASLGPQPPRPMIRPAPLTSRDQGYVGLTPGVDARGWDADSLLNYAEKPFENSGGVYSASPIQPESPHAPRLPVAGFDDFAPGPRALDVPPPNVPAFPYAPGSPSMYRPPAGHPMREPFFGVQTVPTWPRYQQAPSVPRSRMVPRRSYVHPFGARLAMGEGPASTSSYTWAAYAVAGVITGVALKMLYGAVSK